MKLYTETDVKTLLKTAWERGRMPGGSAEAAATQLLSAATPFPPDLKGIRALVMEAWDADRTALGTKLDAQDRRSFEAHLVSLLYGMGS